MGIFHNGNHHLCNFVIIEDRVHPDLVEICFRFLRIFFGDGSRRINLRRTSALRGSAQADGYQNTGCSNLNCPGFVVAPGSPNYLGSPVAPTSTYNGEQRILIIKVSKANDRWNLYVNNQLLGWWPASLFKNLRSAANRVDFGGEVCFRSGGSPGSQFTTTDMGSGHFPSEGFGRSAHIRDVQITDNNGQLIDIPGSVAAGRPHCYNVSIYLDVQNGKHIFFGGPGGDNPGCVV